MDRPDVLFERGFVPDAGELFTWLREHTVWDDRMRARLTASFGQPYSYSDMSYPPAPWPEPLVPVLEALEHRLAYRSNNCLANYYPTGEATMGFHADSVRELAPGTGVAVVSLGEERILRFRRSDDKTVLCDYPLPAGSLLYMPAAVQAVWKHAIPAQPGAGARVSLTFRRLV